MPVSCKYVLTAANMSHVPFQLECQICHKKYTNLSQHINKIHKKNYAMCEKCGKTFYLHSQLRRHKKDVHSY